MKTRCKFRCIVVTEKPDSKDFEFTAVSSGNTEEDSKFHKYTPTGRLIFNCLNPNVSFTPGKAYYLDIIEADCVEAP